VTTPRMGPAAMCPPGARDASCSFLPLCRVTRCAARTGNAPRVRYKRQGESASAGTSGTRPCPARIPAEPRQTAKRCRSRAPHRAGSCSVDAAEMVGTGGAASAASAGGKKGAAYSGTPPPEPRSPPTRVCSAACVGDHCFHVAWRDFAT
jgi:hypothetical protein